VLSPAIGVERRSFPAMGTTVRVVAPPHDGDRLERAVARVRRVFEREERRFSRFRDDSELSRVNASAGRWIRVSEPFAALTRVALDAARETEGLFDPTVLPALRAAGYDRDYRELADPDLAEIREQVRALMIGSATACGAWREIEVAGDRLRLPLGAELDFGGIAKGWTVDAAMHVVADLEWAIVDAGGDLRIAGRAPRGSQGARGAQAPRGGLQIAVEDPHEPGTEILRLRVGEGALATTSVRVRAWGPGLHHVIDPRTGLPSLVPVVQATVWAPTCTGAEVWSKAALLGGAPVLDRVPALLVLDSGEVVTSFDEGADEAIA
jgi:thiamine biosynthesis lipoprotein